MTEEKELFTEKMKSLRELQRLTEKQMAVIAGVDIVEYREFERGEATPTEGQIARLCKFCDIHPDWLTISKRNIDMFESEVHKAINRRKKRRVQYRDTPPTLLGAKLHVLRKVHHLNLEQMAKILKVKKESYWSYERNDIILAQIVLDICCEFFNIKEEKLLDDRLSLEKFEVEYRSKIDDPRRS